MACADDGFIEVLIVVVRPVAQFHGADVTAFGVEAEVVVQTPPVVAQAGVNLVTRNVGLEATWPVGNLHLGPDERLAVGVEGLREGPRQLEQGTDNDTIWIFSIELHA